MPAAQALILMKGMNFEKGMNGDWLEREQGEGGREGRKEGTKNGMSTEWKEERKERRKEGTRKGERK